MNHVPACPARAKRMSRRRLIGCGTAAAILTTLPGAGAGAGRVAASGEVVSAAGLDSLHEAVAAAARRLAGHGETTLTLLLPDGSAPNVLPVIRAFEAATGVTVAHDVAPVDEINMQITLDRMVGSTSYDLALPATFGVPDLAADGAILPLTDLAAHYEPPGFRDGVLYAVGDSFDGEVYGFQADGDAYMMFYNADFLHAPDEQARYADRFGMALTVPETWAELDRQIAFFHRPDAGMQGGLLFRTPGYVAWEWWVRLHAAGKWPLSETLDPQLACDDGVAALEDMIRVGGVLAPEARTAGLFENWARYGQGGIYANIGWGGSQKHFNGPTSAMRGRMVYGPTPGGIVDGILTRAPYFNWGWTYVVTSGSPRPELAYLFALFAASPAMSTLAVAQPDGYFDPVRPEHYRHAAVRAAYSDDFLAVHRDSLVHAIPDLYLARQSDYFLALSNWISRAVDGQLPAREALRRAEREWDMISTAAGREAQAARWRALREKYPAGLRARLTDATG